MYPALSTISEMPSTRDELKRFTSLVKTEIMSNERPALPVLVQLNIIKRAMEDILKDEDIKRHFVDEFQPYMKEGIVSINGVKLNLQETGVKYDYDSSGDPVWNDLNAKIAELTEKRKEREKFLQAIPKDEAGIVDSSTGVFITRPVKKSETQVVVKLA